MKTYKLFGLLVIFVLLVVALPTARTAQAAALYKTITYDDITLPVGFTSINMPGTWDMNQGPVVVTYTLDLSSAPNVAYNWDWNLMGLVGLFDATNASGARMAGFLSDWGLPQFPIYPDNDATQDIDDKFNLQRFPSPGNYDETLYDVKCDTSEVVSAFGSGNNYGIWFDRDGVDQWQDDMWGMVNGGTYNTNGVYDVQLTFQKKSASLGTVCPLMFPNLANPWVTGGYGIPTGFYTAWSPTGPDNLPAGLSFASDETKMGEMHLVVQGASDGGAITISNLTVSGYLNQCTDTCYVDGTNGNDAFGGNIGDPKKTIQAAINQVNAGGTVYVAAGTYNEQIIISKPLTVTGEDGAVLDGTGLPPQWTTGVKIRSGNVTFNNIDVTNFTQDGITAYKNIDMPNLRITNSKISNIQPGYWGFGIYVGYESEGFEYSPPRLTGHLNFSGLLIEGNEITNVHSSALVIQSLTGTPGTLQVKNNYIHDNATNSGIWIDSARNLLIENNTVVNNKWGVEFSAIPEFDNPTFLNGPYSPKDIILRGNTISSSTYQGIVLYQAWPSTITVTGNSIEGNETGVDNQIANTLNATCNWWGAINGPSGEGSGSGDSVSTSVTFLPWLLTSDLDGPCTTPPLLVTAAEDAFGYEGDTLTASGEFSGLGLTLTADNSAGAFIDNSDGTWSWSLATTDNAFQTITVTATDAYGNTATDSFEYRADNIVPKVSIDSVYPTLVAVGSSVTANGSFTDPGTNDTHMAGWDWGDTSSIGTVSGLNVGPDSHIYTAPGIYTIKLTVTDDDTGEGTSTFEFVVVYDSSGGFVTGGGWIDSPAGAYYPSDLPFFDGSYYDVFLSDAPLPWYEARDMATGMTKANCLSAHLATITSQEEYNKVLELFDEYSGAQLGGFQEEGVYPAHIGWQWVTGEPFVFTAWLPGEPNDSPWGVYGDAAEQILEMYPTGWNDVPVDEPRQAFMIEYEDCYGPTGKATFGFVSKYRRGATVPEGNTEFQFRAGNLNFSSTSYEWLVVTGSNYARFKGAGTINGHGDYKFMLWAGDGTGSNGQDTFRIKIWYEDNGSEVVVYDNGMDQAIAGGSIVVHKAK